MQHYFRRLDSGVDKVRQLSCQLCETLNLTMFAHVRIYHDGRVGWVTSDSEHDRLLMESGFLENDPLVDNAQALKTGHYLWFHDRPFPGSDRFYRDRAKFFHLDHGMVLVNHQKEYLETSCFSGLLAKRPLYNLFINELGLFKAFSEYFRQHLTPALLKLLDDGIHLNDFKSSYGKAIDEIQEKRKQVLSACGWSHLLRLSPREIECLAQLREGYTYQGIGSRLFLSPRTVEHYLNSIKNKLGLENHGELFQAAHKLAEIGLLPQPILKAKPLKY